MKTSKVFFGLGIGIVFFIFVIYKISTFTIFDDDIKVILNIKIPKKNYDIKVYYIPPNASSQSYIQLRKNKNGVEETLKNFKNFDNIDSYSLENDTLELVMRSSSLSKSVVKKIQLPKE